MNNKFWKNIWESKGNSKSDDLLFLDGYEHLQIEFNSKDICASIITLADIKQGDRILEVGCGAGFLARELQEYSYVGVDYSESIIKKHKDLFPSHNATISEANLLNYENNSFDVVFCFGLFQYLPNKEYADKTIQEMYRVGKRGIFLGDLKTKKTRKEHFVYSMSELQEKGFKISSCVYDCNDVERFNAYRHKGDIT
tara:strand:+ start:404 stop:994 length:591 start_codon:yes stop_codon:yes gene_type:complete